MQIQSLQIKTSVNNELKQSHQFYVDGELLFECEELDFNVIRKYNIKLFTNNSAFAKVFFKPNSKQHVDSCLEFQNLPVLTSVTKIYTILGMRNINSLFDIADNYTEYLKCTLHVIISRALLENKSFKNIYLGPLRTIPARKDFTGNKLFFRRQRRKQKIINQKSFKCLDKIKPIRFLYSKKYLNFIYWMLWVPLYFYCMSNKIISTFYNSIFITNGIPKFINPNSKSYLHLWYSIVENGKVKKKINQWLKDKGKHNSSYTILSDNTHFSFFDESTQTAVHPQDMGVGISQSLPIIVASHLYKDTNIYIEQPELHLHPKLQMEIADEFIKSINENDNSFVIESHSEHLLLRIMKRMRHTAEDKVEDESLQLTPDDVCLLYVDNNGETTYIKELELDTDGTLLDPWPNGFFEEGHKERFE